MPSIRQPSPRNTGVVVDDLVLVLVELGSQQLFSQCKAHGIGDAWPRGPVVVSTPTVMPTSGWPAVLLCSWRKFFSSSMGES